MLALLQQPVVKEVAKAAQPALSTVAQTVLGAVCLLCMVVTCVAIWQLIRVQNARASDQQQFREEYRALVDQNAKLFDKMGTAVSGLKEVISALTEQEKGSQSVLTQLKGTLDGVQQTMTQLLLLQGRRMSPPSSTPKVRG